MIKILNVTMKNFMSIGNITQAITLNSNGVTLILGQNLDSANGNSKNGCGKSALLQAISFALFGKPLTQIKKDNLVNNINQKNMLVTVEFEKDNKKYKIERGRKPVVLRYYINDKLAADDSTEVEDEAQGDSRNTQVEIEKEIGLSHMMFKNIVALNTFSDPFLKMKVADQRSVIEELLGVTQISTKADVLKKLIINTKEKIKEEEITLKALAEANSRFETTLKQTQTSSNFWESKHKKQIEQLSIEIEAFEKIDFDAELLVFDSIDKWEENEKEYKAFLDLETREFNLILQNLQAETTSLKRLKDQLRSIEHDRVHINTRFEKEKQRKQTDIDNKLESLNGLNTDLNSIEEQLLNPNNHSCTTCGQTLEGTEHLTTVIENLNNQKNLLLKKMERYKNEISELHEDIRSQELDVKAILETYPAKIDKIDADIPLIEQNILVLEEQKTSKNTVINEKKELLYSLGTKPESLFSSREETWDTKNRFQNAMRDFEKELEAVNPYYDQIVNIQNSIILLDYEPLNEANTLLKHQEFVLRLLTNKDSFIRKKIIDQNLNYLNHRMNGYLDKLGLPHELQFKSDLSVYISLLGRDFDFEQLSRGEQCRVNMATSWAFRDVWESLNSSINLLFADEVFDNGLDSAGIEAALSVLKTFGRDRQKNVFLISHREELIGRVDDIIVVKKESGFTCIEHNAQL